MRSYLGSTVLQLFILGGCADPPEVDPTPPIGVPTPPVASTVVPAITPVVCADPDARTELAFDVVILPNEPNAEHRFVAAGLSGGDFDGDGDIDLFVPGPTSARLLLNAGDGATWTEAPSAIPDRPYFDAVGSAAADFDADGDLDVVVTRYLEPDVLLVNAGDGTFTEHGQALPPMASQSATWLDTDLDGHLDLLVAGHGAIDAGPQLDIVRPGDPSLLWLGDGAGGFVDRSDRFDASVSDGYTYVLGWTHLPGDAIPDLLVANDYPNYIPTLAAPSTAVGGWSADDGSLGLNLLVAGMGLGIADVSGDGVDDFLFPAWDRLVVVRSTTFGPWINIADAAGFTVNRPRSDLAWIGWGGDWADVDNDGDFDAIVAFGNLDTVVDAKANGDSVENAELQRYGVYVQDGDAEGHWTEGAASLGIAELGVWRGFTVADLNGDGWVDLAARDQNGRLVIWVSRCGSEGWVTVRPEPIDQAVGAEVVVIADGRRFARTIRAGGTSLASSNPPEATIGLGPADAIDDVLVVWPDGAETHTGPMPARAVVTIAR